MAGLSPWTLWAVDAEAGGQAGRQAAGTERGFWPQPWDQDLRGGSLGRGLAVRPPQDVVGAGNRAWDPGP